MPSAVAAQIYERLERIRRLAKEVEDIPNLLPDVWTMNKIDEKCRVIQQDASWVYGQVQRHIGTGAG
jgi:hypothetical protein